MTINVFEQATRQKLRFQTRKGVLSAENLFDLPLTSERNLSLNEVGKVLQKKIRDEGGDDLVTNSRATSENVADQLRLDIIKEVIRIREFENAQNRDRITRNAELQKLLDLKAQKVDEKIMAMSEEEIDAQIAALNAA